MLFYQSSYLSVILSMHCRCYHIYVLLSPTKTFMYRSWLYQVNKFKCKCVTRITHHITDTDTMPNRLGTRLVTTMTMTIPPHHVAVTPSSHPICSMNITTELIEVIVNPLLYIKQPYLCDLDTLHRFYNRNQSKCIILAVNVSDEELRTNKE